MTSLPYLSILNEPRKEDDDEDILENDFDREFDREDDFFEDGPYCSACQNSPCVCSDPERSSTIWEQLLEINKKQTPSLNVVFDYVRYKLQYSLKAIFKKIN